MIRRKIFTSVAALTVVAMAWLTPSARAAFSIEVIINGGAPIIIADQSGSDSHPAVNDIGFRSPPPGSLWSATPPLRTSRALPGRP